MLCVLVPPPTNHNSESWSSEPLPLIETSHKVDLSYLGYLRYHLQDSKSANCLLIQYNILFQTTFHIMSGDNSLSSYRNSTQSFPTADIMQRRTVFSGEKGLRLGGIHLGDMGQQKVSWRCWNAYIAALFKSSSNSRSPKNLVLLSICTLHLHFGHSTVCYVLCTLNGG